MILYHISDVHIRLYERQEQYNHVFQNLYNHLQKQKSLGNQGLIVFTGDLFHNKINLSPQSVRLASQFLLNLSNIYKVILIQGNHDLNYNNNLRLDSITPVVQALGNQNIVYLTNDKLFHKQQNLIFYFIDDSNTQIVKKIVQSDNNSNITKIGLYHGVVDGCILDSGMKMERDTPLKQYFEQLFDYVLLGDIHKRQYMNTQKTIAYAGSLIQQNFGQSLDGHGLIKWDMKSGKSQFIDIQNKYGLVTLYINKGKVVNTDIPIPENSKVRMYVSQSNQVDVLNISKQLKEDYNISNIIQINNDKTDFKSIQLKDDKQVTNLIRQNSSADVNYQNKLIDKYLKSKYLNIDDKVLDQIHQINTQLNKLIPIPQISTGFIWNLKKLEWQNMFRYGKDNIINFEQNEKNSILGLMGLNHSGKSSIIDVLLYCLFDKCSRSNLGNSILNKRQKQFKCKLTFEIDGLVYTIQRIGNRSGKSVSVKVQFGFTNTDGQYISLNGIDRNDTNKQIIKTIGCNYDTFVGAFLSLQDTQGSSFIKLKQSNRKQFINNLFNLDIFDYLHKLSQQNLNKHKLQYNVLLKQLDQLDIDKYKDNILQLNRQITQEIKPKIQQQQVYLSKHKDSLEQLFKKLIQIKNIKTINIPQTKSIIQNKQKQIVQCLDNCKQIKIKVDETNIQLQSLQKQLQLYNIEQLKQAQIDYNNIQQEISNLNIQSTKIKSQLQNSKSKTQMLTNLQYDQNCSYCMNNPFVKDAIKSKESINEYISQIESITKQIQNKQTKSKSYLENVQLYNKALSIERNISKVTTTLSNHKQNFYTNKTNAVNIKQQIQKLRNDIEQYKKNEQSIKHNQNVQIQINNVKNQISGIQTTIKTYQRQLSDNQHQIKRNQSLIDTTIQMKKNFGIVSKKVQLFNYYSQSLHKNGIPLLILDDLLPSIEGRINSLLSTITDFVLELKVEDNNKLNIYIIYNNEDTKLQVQLGSGFEKFISQLCIKITLSELTNTNRCNFFIIDEGFGAMDNINMGNLGDMFQILKSKYDYTIVVSHIMTIHDYIDKKYSIEINQNGYSQIS